MGFVEAPNPVIHVITGTEATGKSLFIINRIARAMLAERSGLVIVGDEENIPQRMKVEAQFLYDLEWEEFGKQFEITDLIEKQAEEFEVKQGLESFGELEGHKDVFVFEEATKGWEVTKVRELVEYAKEHKINLTIGEASYMGWVSEVDNLATTISETKAVKDSFVHYVNLKDTDEQDTKVRRFVTGLSYHGYK